MAGSERSGNWTGLPTFGHRKLPAIKTSISSEQTLRLMLKALQQVTQAVNENFSRAQILRFYENILRQFPSVRGVALYSRQNGELRCEFSDWDFEGASLPFSVENYLEQLGELQIPYHLPDSELPFNVVIPSYHKERVLGYLLARLDSNPEAGPEDPDSAQMQSEFLQTLNNVVFVALENKMLAREALRQEALRKEIELASELQALLFPQSTEGLAGVAVSGSHKTFDEVGGDYYDYFPLPDGDVALCIADVSGKGMAAALLMANFQANVRALFPYVPDLAQLGHTLNKKVDESAQGEKFITCFIARYDPRRRLLHYANLGHNPPLFLSGTELSTLDAQAPALGMLPELPSFATQSLSIAPDDLLVAYTDGLTELHNEDNQLFGLERLKNIVLENRILPLAELNSLILRHLNSFRGESPFRDDIALLTCRFF